MKIKWIAPLILCMACGSHQAVEQQRKDAVPDTTKTITGVVSDSSATAPMLMKDTVREPPGPVLVFVTDLNYDSIPDTISLRTLAKDTLSYDRITVSIARYGKQSFTSASSWYQVDKDFPGGVDNAYPTSYFFLAKNGVETVLALFGWVGEVDRDEFSIIRIKDNIPRMVFDQHHWKDNFIERVEFIRDMDNDGRFEFGYGHLTDGVEGKQDGLEGFVGQYVPTLVYTIDDSLVLNKPVMKKYNQEHYIFAGYEPGGVMIFRPNDTTKKLRVWRH